MDEYPIVPMHTDEIIEEEEFERLYSAPAEIIALLSIFYGGISIVAVIGNTLVIWVVATTRQMRTVTNMYIANLAFADVIIGIFCIPFQFQAALLQRWNLPWFMCGFCPFVQALSVNVSVFTLTAIAIDRHRAIINPLRARPSKFVSKLIIFGIWVVSLIFAIPCAIAFRVELIHERFKDNGFVYNMTRPFCLNQNLSEDQLQVYRYTLVFVQYLVPFCVISFVYIQMATKLWGTRAPGNAQDSRDMTLLKNKKKVIKMLIIVVIVFGLCWLPLQLYNILYVTIPEINEYHFISIVWFVCDWLAMSNSCYNPFIYGIYNEKFKREFNKRFSACFCKFGTRSEQPDRTVSMHTRASSVRSTLANASTRGRYSGGGVSGHGKIGLIHCPYYRKDQDTTTLTMLKNIGTKNTNGSNTVYNAIMYGKVNMKRQTFDKMELPDDKTAASVGSNNGNGKFKYPWRRTHFKPLNPDVIENEDDSGLLEIQPAPTSVSEQELSLFDDEICKSESLRETASCICELELGSRTECDGTCILNEVSRVQAPPITTTDALIISNSTATATATATTTLLIPSDVNKIDSKFYTDDRIEHFNIRDNKDQQQLSLTSGESSSDTATYYAKNLSI